MHSEYQIKQDIVEVGRRIYTKGFVAANDGNISVRMSENEVLTTPTGVSKGYMSVDMIIKVDMAGRKISGDLKPSSELKMHLDVYKNRPDVKSVLHAHPPTATAFAVAGIPLNKPILPEVVITLGSCPIAKYGTPSTDEIPDNIRDHLQKHDAVLLENHGALTIGTSVFDALFKMENIEHFAKVSLIARQLGGENEIPAIEVEKLIKVRESLGVVGRNPYCTDCGACKNCSDQKEIPLEKMSESQLNEIVSSVVRKVISDLNN